jgi:hypothetical protein
MTRAPIWRLMVATGFRDPHAVDSRIFKRFDTTAASKKLCNFAYLCCFRPIVPDRGVYAARQPFIDISNDWWEKVHSAKKIPPVPTATSPCHPPSPKSKVPHGCFGSLISLGTAGRPDVPLWRRRRQRNSEATKASRAKTMGSIVRILTPIEHQDVQKCFDPGRPRRYKVKNFGRFE